MSELRAYSVPDSYVVEGFVSMTQPYERLIGLCSTEQTVWDERVAPNSSYHAAQSEAIIARRTHIPTPPPEAGELMRLRSSVLKSEEVSLVDKQVAEKAFADVLDLIPKDVPFTKLAARLKEGNHLAIRPATYDEGLYALELARLITGGVFNHRIACYELSLTAALYCHAKGLSIDWCLGLSFRDQAAHAWLEVNGEAVRGEVDEVVTGVYQKLYTLGVH